MATMEDFMGDMSTLDYARLHGIATDHIKESLPLSHIQTLQSLNTISLADDSNLFSIEHQKVPNLEERLFLDKDAAIFIARARQGLANSETIDADIVRLCDVRKTRKLKMEPPLLRTDPDCDFRAFAQFEQLDIRDGYGRLPAEPVDDERDDSLAWPSYLLNLRKKLWDECEKEKISLVKEDLLYLQHTLKDHWTTQDNEELIAKESAYIRNPALTSLTPPLTTLSPPYEPYIPSSPASHLPFLSDPPSLTRMDLEAVEKIIFQDDAILAPPRDSFQDSETPKDECINPRDLYLNFEDTPSDELIPQSTRVKPDDRKVEVPLTPPDPISTSKTVTFSEIVEEMLLDTEFSDGGEDADMDALRDDPLFHRGEAYEMLKQASEAVHNTLNNEQLQEAATTKQVKVPVLDFTAPEPPWKQLEILRGSEKLTAGQRAMVLRTKQEYPFPDRATGLKVLESRIRWTPFPADLAKVALEEEIGDDEKVENLLMMTKDSDVIDSSGMTWKAPGLRILRNDDEDEDDLEPGTFMSEQPEDMTSLLKKRKLHMTDHNSFANSSQKLTALENLVTQMSAGVEEFRKVESMMMKSTMPRRKNTPSMPGDSATARAKFQDDLQENLSLVDQNFSAENALDKFMEIRGVKKPKLMTSAHFAAPTAAQELDGPDKLDQNLHQATAQALRPFPTNFPIPHIVAPSSSTPFIISSNMMKERVLVRAFQRLFPKAELIERDFKRHNTTSWLRPGSVTRSPVASPLASEADFILSPSTGLVLTTLTKIKQKPLPGEKGESEIKERIKNVCRRYERLVVLVSEAASDETTNGLNGQDSMGLSEFIGFCNSLPASVNAHFVPGGHETLAKWLVAIMIQYGIHDFSFGGLIEDETVWELFLRRCGFNAYAAQAILSVLKAPEGVNLESPSKAGIFGITAFVEMSFEERVERFEILLGGKRVLQQVSAIIDAQWLL